MHEQLAGYISGPVNAEDLAVAPGGEWVLTSGMTGPTAPLGRLYAVSVATGACNEIFPYRATSALDSERFVQQPDLNPLKFRPHGIDVGLRPDGRVELYVVNHGGNESVEVFDVDLDESRPALKWIGGVRLPGTAVGNDVAAVDDGFVVSTTGDPDGRTEVSVEEAMAGADTGGVLEWSPAQGWVTLPGTQINTANGVAVSPDGQWLYIGGWNSRCLRKVRRGSDLADATTVSLDIMVDNLTWSASGRLLAAGTYGTSMQDFLESHLSQKSPNRLSRRGSSASTRKHSRRNSSSTTGPDTFGAATTALTGRPRDLGRHGARPGPGPVPVPERTRRTDTGSTPSVSTTGRRGIPESNIDATEGTTNRDRSRCDSHPCGLPTARTRHHRNDRVDSARHRRGAVDPRTGRAPCRRPKSLVLTRGLS